MRSSPLLRTQLCASDRRCCLLNRSTRLSRSPARFFSVHNLFTGIVQGKAQVHAISRKADFRSFEIQLPSGAANGVQIGASVAINGTCLTVVEQHGDVLHFDVIGETLKRTNLGDLTEGAAVNFERSAKVGDEIGGHTVSGHVHTTAIIIDVQETENNVRLEFQLQDPSWVKYVLPKGFVAVDGCSLTVGEVTATSFSVYLIPETLRVTVLGLKGKGDIVNIEAEAQTQAIVDTVERVVARYLQQQEGVMEKPLLLSTIPINGTTIPYRQVFASFNQHHILQIWVREKTFFHSTSCISVTDAYASYTLFIRERIAAENEAISEEEIQRQIKEDCMVRNTFIQMLLVNVNRTIPLIAVDRQSPLRILGMALND